MEKKKTFEELFAGTGIEPTTDENGGVHYNFNATLKTNAEASDKAVLLTPKGTLTIGEEYSSPSISFYKNDEVENVITIKYTKFMYKGEEVKDLQTIYDIIKSLTSIELPSDEDIKSYSDKYSTIHEDVSDKLGKYLVSAIHIDGAKWMKEKILNQNK
jgi:hypothetical protein